MVIAADSPKAMITGQLTGEEMAREHPQKLDAIDCAEQRAEPAPEPEDTAGR